jgi:rubredoxin
MLAFFEKMAIIPLGSAVHKVEDEPRPTGAERDSQGGTVEKYECTVCGYVYNPRRGDPAGDIEPGTSFDDLPDDWICPECGADLDAFEILD